MERLLELSLAQPFFADWEESFLHSCLHGVMGEIYVDDLSHPCAAMALLGDFCFFAGEANAALLRESAQAFTRATMILVPQSVSWSLLIEAQFGAAAQRTTRYATQKERDAFDVEQLRRAVAALPAEYELRPIEQTLFAQCKSLAWCDGWVEQYADYETYRAIGLGVAILKDGAVIAGASSYLSFPNGIEVQIDTHPDFQRRGLAYVAGAQLILDALARGWYPSWDAQNKASLALAEKLGYRFAGSYTAYVTQIKVKENLSCFN